MAITDTSPEASALQLEIQRSMSGEQRMTLAYEMSMFVRSIMKEGIEHDHPEWTEAQVKRELLRRAFIPARMPAWLRSGQNPIYNPTYGAIDTGPEER